MARRLDSNLLSAKQVAERLGVSVAFIRKATYRRELPCIRASRRLARYRAEDLARFIQERPALPPMHPEPAGGEAEA